MMDFEPTGDPLIDIPAFVEWQGDHITFIELLKALPYLRGDQTIYFGDDKKVLWVGVSPQCIDALNVLIAEKRIFQWLCHPRTYLLDGGGLDMPLVKRVQKYKTPHWMPVSFASRPPSDDENSSIARSFGSIAS